MQTDGRILSPRLLGTGHVAIDDVRIFTMRHQGQLATLEDTLQDLLAVNEHVSRRRTHKELDARDAGSVELAEGIDIVVGGTIEEGIVDMALLTSQCLFLFQSLQRGGLRIAVRHIEVAGDATGSCRTALRIDVCLFRQSWLTEVYVVVDDTWQYVATRGIYRFVE